MGRGRERTFWLLRGFTSAILSDVDAWRLISGGRVPSSVSSSHRQRCETGGREGGYWSCRRVSCPQLPAIDPATSDQQRTAANLSTPDRSVSSPRFHRNAFLPSYSNFARAVLDTCTSYIV